MEKARLDKIIAAGGRYSRREVRQLIRQGRVLVDGVPARAPEDKVDPESAEILVNGERLCYRRFTWLMLHKPAGVLSATEDGRGETVLDLLAPELRRQQIQHGLPAAVLRGRQHPGGLVEHQPGKTAVAQPLPVHKDLRGLRVHLVLRRPGGHAVHQDPALPDQLPDLPPGVPAPCGDDLIQPRFFHIVPSACDFFCSILS